MRVRPKLPKLRKPEAILASRTLELPADEVTELAVDMALKISLAGKSVKEAREVIMRAKSNPEFMELWHRLGKEAKDLDEYIKQGEQSC